jgi:hypothetical protein
MGAISLHLRATMWAAENTGVGAAAASRRRETIRQGAPHGCRDLDGTSLIPAHR